MAATPNTKLRIIESAIEELKTSGTEGLSLRKVATRAEVSLGNLQYHFNDKASLFAGLGEHYFEQCTQLLDDYEPLAQNKPLDQKFSHLILYHLDHLDNLTEMCRMFRELWALATRDSEVSAQLNQYYELSVAKLEAIITKLCEQPNHAGDIARLLIPYFEGYSITCDALDRNKGEIASLLTRLSCAFLD